MNYSIINTEGVGVRDALSGGAFIWNPPTHGLMNGSEMLKQLTPGC